MEPQPTRTDGGPEPGLERRPEMAAESTPGSGVSSAVASGPVGTATPAWRDDPASMEEASEPVPTAVVPSGLPVGSTGSAETPGEGPRVRFGALGYVLAALAGVVLTAAAFIGAGAVAIGGPAPTPAPTFATTDAAVGVASAPVTIQIWADYQCPYCAIFTHGIEPTLLRDYAATGRALVEFKDFAFLGPESTDAAVAAACAGRQGKFWTYHDLVYASQSGENQGAFVRQNLLSLAAFVGLDDATFKACLDDPTVAAAVAAQTEEGRGLGVESTPTLRITGPGGTKLVKGITEPSAIAAAVDAVARPAASPGAAQSPGTSGGSPSGTSPATSPTVGPDASPDASGSAP